MSKITRAVAKIFGSSAGVDEIGVFGSLAAGSIAYSTDPATIQSLSNYLTGWFGAVVGGNSPAIEDMNAVHYVFSYQIAYLMQAGVAEWNAATTYYIGSLVNSAGVLYTSLVDDNLNHSVTDSSKWTLFGVIVDGTSASPVSVGGATAIPSGTASQQVYVTGNNSAWTPRTAPALNVWNSVCWSQALGLFVAVSITGSGDQVMASSDGITWVGASESESNEWVSVCWAQALGLFVAVARTGTHRVMTSPDGTTWTNQTAAEANQWESVCWSARLGLLVAVAKNGTNRVMTSPDGTTWTARSAAEANSWESVCWSDALGLFAAVSTDGTHRVMTSANGTTWSARTAAEVNPWQAICWSPELGLFCATSATGTHKVMISSDGIYWTRQTAPAAADSVCWSKELGLFVSVGNNANGINSSPDGVNWVTMTYPNPTTDTFGSVCWSPDLLMFAAVGASTDRILTLAPTLITAGSQIAAGSYTGQQTTVIGTSDQYQVGIKNGAGVASPRGTVFLGKNKVAKYLWDATQSAWILAAA